MKSLQREETQGTARNKKTKPKRRSGERVPLHVEGLNSLNKNKKNNWEPDASLSGNLYRNGTLENSIMGGTKEKERFLGEKEGRGRGRVKVRMD